MLSEALYTNFSTLVGLSVAFGFGLFYLYRNKRSVFIDVLRQISKALRKNFVSCQLEHYFAYVAKKCNKKNTPKKLRRMSGVLKGIMAPVCISPLNAEITCSYLAVIGALSGIYSVVWLFIMPASALCDSITKSVYMTITVSTFAAEGIMTLYILFRQMERVKAFIISIIILILANGVGLFLLSHGYYLLSPLPFNRFFLRSMIVPYMPIIIFAGHLLLSICTRLVLFIITIIMAMTMHLMSLR